MRYLWLIFLPCLAFGQVSKKSESSVVTFYEKKVANTKDRYLTVEVGDSTQTKFDPSFNISAWEGECEFRLNLSTIDKPLGLATRNVGTMNGKDKTTLATGDVTHELYVRTDGNFEWEIILPSKPDTNVFIYQIETKGLDFHYQSELTQEEIDGGAIRPDSVVGSYAVYHNSKANNRVIIDGKDTTFENYMIGKAFHIYRPTVRDASDSFQFCHIEIDTIQGTLSLTIPQTFLNNAHYPIVIGPTFGETGEGSSGITNRAYCNVHADYLHTASTGDEIISFHAFSYSVAAPEDVDMAVYSMSGDDPQSRLAAAVGVSVTSGSPAVWYQTGVSQALSNGVTYGVAVASTTSETVIYYETIGGLRASRNSSTTLPATWDEHSTSTSVYSMYVTYTTGGEPPAGQVIIIQ